LFQDAFTIDFGDECATTPFTSASNANYNINLYEDSLRDIDTNAVIKASCGVPTQEIIFVRVENKGADNLPYVSNFVSSPYSFTNGDTKVLF